MSYDARSDEIRTRQERAAMEKARVGRSGPITRADVRRAEKIIAKGWTRAQSPSTNQGKTNG